MNGLYNLMIFAIIYRIMADLKIEKYHRKSERTSCITSDFVCKIFRTDIIVFIGNITMCLTSP